MIWPKPERCIVSVSILILEKNCGLKCLWCLPKIEEKNQLILFREKFQDSVTKDFSPDSSHIQFFEFSLKKANAVKNYCYIMF